MWNVECGMWNVECRMWNVECGMWNVECGMLGEIKAFYLKTANIFQVRFQRMLKP